MLPQASPLLRHPAPAPGQLTTVPKAAARHAPVHAKPPGADVPRLSPPSQLAALWQRDCGSDKDGGVRNTLHFSGSEPNGRQPYHVHSQQEPACSSTSSNGDKAGPSMQHSRGMHENNTARVSRARGNSREHMRRPPQRLPDQQLPGVPYMQQADAASLPLAFSRDVQLGAIRSVDTVADLHDVCSRISAARLQQQQGRKGRGSRSLQPDSRPQLQLKQQRRRQPPAPGATFLSQGTPPAAVVTAAAAKLAELLARDTHASSARSARSAVSPHPPRSHTLAGQWQQPQQHQQDEVWRRREQRQQQQWQEEESWWGRVEGGMEQDSPAPAVGAMPLEYRQAVRSLCRLLCRYALQVAAWVCMGRRCRLHGQNDVFRKAGSPLHLPHDSRTRSTNSALQVLPGAGVLYYEACKGHLSEAF